MSVAAAQADAFYREALSGERVYAIRDEGGFPAPMASPGVRSMPFWSKASRAEKIVKNVDAYEGMHVVEIVLEQWLNKWLPDLQDDGLLVGLNWSGSGATGYDLSVEDLLRNLDARRTLGAS